MSNIYVTEGQPFQDNRRVVLLSFDYHPKTVATVKEILSAVRRMPGVPAYKAGGWLREIKRWYIDPCCWTAVGRRLVEAGYTLLGDVDVSEAEEARVQAAQAELAKLIARMDAVIAARPKIKSEILYLLDDYRNGVKSRGATAMDAIGRRLLSLLEGGAGGREVLTMAFLERTAVKK
jgi:hypothetical protein